MNGNYLLFIFGVVIFTVTTVLGVIGLIADLDTSKLTNLYIIGVGLMVTGLGLEYFETKKDKEIKHV